MGYPDSNTATQKSVEGILTAIKPQQRTVFDLAVGTAGNGNKLEVSLESKAPARLESPPRRHIFQDVAGFKSYLNKYATDNTVIFCDVSTRSFNAVLDEKAKDQFEIVSFAPQEHPDFAAWSLIFGKGQAFKQLSAFFQKMRRTLNNGAALATIFRQINASTQVSLLEGRGNGAINGLTIQTKITAGASADKDIELPETLSIKCPMFLDSPAALRELDLILEALPDGRGIVATVTYPNFEEDRFEELKAYFEVIKSAAGDKWPLAFGRPQHGDWNYLDAPML